MSTSGSAVSCPLLTFVSFSSSLSPLQVFGIVFIPLRAVGFVHSPELVAVSMRAVVDIQGIARRGGGDSAFSKSLPSLK